MGYVQDWFRPVDNLAEREDRAVWWLIEGPVVHRLRLQPNDERSAAGTRGSAAGRPAAALG